LVGFGAEAVIARALPVRLGFNTRNDAELGITAGVGWRFRDFMLDYAFVPYGDLGISHRISVTWQFGEGAGASWYEYRKEEGERRARPRGIKKKPRAAPRADDPLVY
ncbi:MAG: hypothetical protein AAB576_03810, partial [Elusimicrobiota bacterium]